MSTEQANQRINNRQSTNDYYRVVDVKTGESLGRLIDVSDSGFRIIAAENIETKNFDFMICLPRMLGYVQAVPLQASLKWCEYNRRHDWFEAGFKIDDISDPSRKVLDLIIKEIVSNR